MQKEEVIYYLKHPDEDKVIWKDIHKLEDKIQEIQSQREHYRDEFIYSTQVKMSPPDAIKVKSSNKSDVGDVSERATTFIDKYEKELMIKFNKLMEQLENHKRIYLVKETLIPFHKSIIKMHYEDDLPLRVLEHEFKKDHKTMHRKLKQIVENITNTFNSSMTNEQLALLKSTSELEKMEFKPNDVIKGQMNIDEFIRKEEK